MKNIIKLSAILFLFVTSSVFAQDGTYMEMKITSPGGITGTIKNYFAAGNNRSEMEMKMPQMPGGGMHTIMLIKKDNPKNLISLNEKSKTYTETDIKDNANEKETYTYTVKKIGEENVNGYKCIHSIIIGSKKDTYDAWTSKQVPYYEEYNRFSQADPQMGSAARDNAMKAAGVEGFPVKMMSKSSE